MSILGTSPFSQPEIMPCVVCAFSASSTCVQPFCSRNHMILLPISLLINFFRLGINSSKKILDRISRIGYLITHGTMIALITQLGTKSQGGIMEAKAFSLPELSRMYPISKTTLLKWVKSGKLKAIKTTPGSTRGKWIVSAEEVDRVFKGKA